MDEVYNIHFSRLAATIEVHVMTLLCMTVLESYTTYWREVDRATMLYILLNAIGMLNESPSVTLFGSLVPMVLHLLQKTQSKLLQGIVVS